MDIYLGSANRLCPDGFERTIRPRIGKGHPSAFCSGCAPKVQTLLRVIAPAVRRVGITTRNGSTVLAEIAVREDAGGVRGSVSGRPGEMPVPPPEDRGGPGSTDDREHARAVRRAVPSARGTPLAAEVPLRCASGRRDASGRRRRVPGSGPVRHGIELEPRGVRRRLGARCVRRVGCHPLRGDQDPPRLPPRGRRPRRRDEGPRKGLARLIGKRDELARLLELDHFADYITADKMIETADAARAFLSKVANVAEPRAHEDYNEILARKRRDVPEAEALERWDLNYYTEIVRAESYAFDAKLLRPYFEFRRVRDGLFSLTSRMFGVRYRRISGTAVWHPSVQVDDLHRGRRRIGRFYLDLHPRKDKYTHAAAAGLVVGTAGHRLPQAALMCNFPDPDGGHGPALMDFSEVETFFHEFGHLLHGLLSGGVRWGRNAMGGIEWDFVEAPSQMLEEWVRDPEVLRTFALHHETGEPLPADVIAQMRRAEAFGRAYEVQRQLLYATLSLLYYTRDAAGIDTTAVLREAHSRFPLIPHFEGTHFQCNFGHLNGYSAIYYTYMWSLVIAKDLFSRFRAHRSLLDPAEAARYRDLILGRGREKPAAELVRDFLGREMRFGPFEAWLREAG